MSRYSRSAAQILGNALHEHFGFRVSVPENGDLIAQSKTDRDPNAPILIGTETAAHQHIVNNSGHVRSLSGREAADLGYDISPRYGR